MAPSTQTIIQQTKNWIKQVVIGLDLCPFADRTFNDNSIDYIVVDSVKKEQHLQQPALQQHTLEKLADSFSALDKNTAIETSLLIFPDSYSQFDDYLELLHLANLLLEDLRYSGTYQIASFHPDYCFAGCKKDDASNFSNRSPYPMLHILREKSIEQAIAGYEDIESVPENNIKKLQKIGYEKMQQKLNRCRQET
jgi:hypothetical protein